MNGQELGLGGYLDIGLIDTMQDLIVNFIGAFVFSVIGFFYVKNRGKGKLAGRFIPRRKAKDRDFLKIARENALQDEAAETGKDSEAAPEKEDPLPEEKEEKRAEDGAGHI